MVFLNKMAPGVPEVILRAEHESFHHVRFSRKMGWKPLKIAFLNIFVELNTDVLESSLLSETNDLCYPELATQKVIAGSTKPKRPSNI